MYRTLCVLALLTLQAGLAHSFYWDIATASRNQLKFFNEEKATYSVSFSDVNVRWMSYDPFHNRLLLMNNSASLLSFDIATGKKQTLIDFQGTTINRYHAYDPVTGLFFSMSDSYKIYSHLVKPGNKHEVEENFVIDLGDWGINIAVDSCRGYIYWIISEKFMMERARLDGSGREVVIESNKPSIGLTIDPQTQKMYWMELDFDPKRCSIISADLNGKHRIILHKEQDYHASQLTVSKYFIYWAVHLYDYYWKFPKNQLGTNVRTKHIAYNFTLTSLDKRVIAANYAIEEQTQGIPLCKALKRLLPNYSNGSLLRVNETIRDPRISGDTWDVSVCQYYCLQGHCSTNADGQPKCRCNAGYSGVRCEVNACQSYCLNNGVCSLSELNKPVCQCTEGYLGERCNVPVFLNKCSETVSMLKDILNKYLTSVTEGKGVNSTCASTVV